MKTRRIRLVIVLALALLSGIPPATAHRPATSPDGPDRAALVAACSDGRMPAISFWADADRLERGQCTTLHWDVGDARAVYLSAGAGPWMGVPARSTMQVCPGRKMEYVLRPFAEDKLETRALTIRVWTPQAYLPLVLKGYLPPPGNMVLIPAGAFQMGCDPTHNGGYACMPDELPLHTVYLDAFVIDTMKVTNGQYARCVALGSCTPPADFSSFTRPSYYENSDYSDYPVIHVTWDQARTYCARLGRRLPTEAEWEKAARGAGAVRAYPWGDEAPACALANFAPDAACAGDTTAVASYPLGASPYGVLDMAGNVREWVNDWYQADYYSVSPPANPPGPATGCYECSRGVRGSTWYDGSRYLRTAHRGYLLFAPYERADVGFRRAASP